MILIGITNFILALNDYAKFAVMLVHIPSGALMVLIPLLDYKTEGWTMTLAAVGGILMSIAGVLLAFAVLNVPILPLATIWTLLPWLLLLVAVCLTFGYLYTEKYTYKVPLLKP